MLNNKKSSYCSFSVKCDSKLNSHCLPVSKEAVPFWIHHKFCLHFSQNSLLQMCSHHLLLPPDKIRGPARGGGSHVACLNLKMSCVTVLSYFTSLSVVELKENCLSLSGFKFSIRIAVRCGFILCAVATFWAMSLVGIYRGRVSNKLYTGNSIHILQMLKWKTFSVTYMYTVGWICL